MLSNELLEIVVEHGKGGVMATVLAVKYFMVPDHGGFWHMEDAEEFHGRLGTWTTTIEEALRQLMKIHGVCKAFRRATHEALVEVEGIKRRGEAEWEREQHFAEAFEDGSIDRFLTESELDVDEDEETVSD